MGWGRINCFGYIRGRNGTMNFFTNSNINRAFIKSTTNAAAFMAGQAMWGLWGGHGGSFGLIEGLECIMLVGNGG